MYTVAEGRTATTNLTNGPGLQNRWLYTRSHMCVCVCVSVCVCGSFKQEWISPEYNNAPPPASTSLNVLSFNQSDEDGRGKGREDNKVILVFLIVLLP